MRIQCESTRPSHFSFSSFSDLHSLASSGVNFFFKFLSDKSGRVDEVCGVVVPYALKVSSAPCKPDCYTAMDSMYDPATGTHPTGIDVHNGHIIGAQLGGAWANADPLNFFPHSPSSNSQNGRWWRMEMIARELKDALDQFDTNCGVGIWIKFAYNSGMKSTYQASGGEYEIDVKDSCFNYISSMKLAPAYAQAFINHAKQVGDAFAHLLTAASGKVNAGVPGRRLAITWTNDGTDKASKSTTPALYN